MFRAAHGDGPGDEGCQSRGASLIVSAIDLASARKARRRSIAAASNGTVVFPINETLHRVPVAEPTFSGLDIDQAVLRPMPEDVPEGEAVRPIAREPRPQALPEQLAALFEGHFKVLGADPSGEASRGGVLGVIESVEALERLPDLLREFRQEWDRCLPEPNLDGAH